MVDNNVECVVMVLVDMLDIVVDVVVVYVEGIDSFGTMIEVMDRIRMDWPLVKVGVVLGQE